MARAPITSPMMDYHNHAMTITPNQTTATLPLVNKLTHHSPIPLCNLAGPITIKTTNNLLFQPPAMATTALI